MKKLICFVACLCATLFAGIAMVGCSAGVGLSNEWLIITMAEDAFPLNGEEFSVEDFPELELRIVIYGHSQNVRSFSVAIQNPSNRNIIAATRLLNERDDVLDVRRPESYVQKDGNYLGNEDPTKVYRPENIENTLEIFNLKSAKVNVGEDSFTLFQSNEISTRNERRVDGEVGSYEYYHTKLQKLTEGNSNITNRDIELFLELEGFIPFEPMFMGLPGNSEFWSLIASNPHLAPSVLTSMSDADNKTQYFYLPNGNIGGSGYGGNHLDNGDAFRHAYWNALMVKRIDSIPLTWFNARHWAERFATAYEGDVLPYGHQDYWDQQMDFVNNARGRDDGWAHRSLCNTALANHIMMRVSLGHYVRIVDDNGKRLNHFISTNAVNLKFNPFALHHGSVFTIRNAGSGLNLDVAGASENYGAQVIQSTPHGCVNQRWRVHFNGDDGTYSFEPIHTDKFLESHGMRFIIHSMYHHHDGKRFYVFKQNDRYKIIPKNAVIRGRNNVMLVTNNNSGLQVTEDTYNANSLHHHWIFENPTHGLMRVWEDSHQLFLQASALVSRNPFDANPFLPHRSMTMQITVSQINGRFTHEINFTRGQHVIIYNSGGRQGLDIHIHGNGTIEIPTYRNPSLFAAEGVRLKMIEVRV